MNYEEYKKLRKQIADEYEQELAALERVWKRFQNLNSPTLKTDVGANNERRSNVPIAKYIRAAIKDFRQDFTADDVEQSIADHGFAEKGQIASVSITNTLHRLFRSGEIAVVKRGEGRTGSIYRLTPSGDKS